MKKRGEQDRMGNQPVRGVVPNKTRRKYFQSGCSQRGHFRSQGISGNGWRHSVITEAVGATDIWRVEPRAAAQLPTMHRMVLQLRLIQADVNHATCIEKLRPTLKTEGFDNLGPQIETQASQTPGIPPNSLWKKDWGDKAPNRTEYVESAEAVDRFGKFSQHLYQ